MFKIIFNKIYYIIDHTIKTEHSITRNCNDKQFIEQSLFIEEYQHFNQINQEINI